MTNYVCMYVCMYAHTGIRPWQLQLILKSFISLHPFPSLQDWVTGYLLATQERKII